MSDTPQKPAADASQLWSAPVDYGTPAVQAANGALSAAQQQLLGAAGAPEADREFLRKKAEGEQIYAQAQLSNAQGMQKQYEQQAFVVKTHNEPIEAQLRAQQEAEAAAKAAALAKFALAAVATTMVADAASQPGGLTGAFSGFGLGIGPAATVMAMSPGPLSLFNRSSASPKELGVEPSLDKQLGPMVLPGVAIDDVAQKSPVVAAELAAPAADPAAPVAQRPVTPLATGLGLELHNNSMANGPKKPSWANNGSPGGSVG